ncbi:hypothetical protein VKT23_000441 [Stygiomarasmius scandens]|uniref:Uncharacterized protein n=1 Tax=Marasmiellus scandens TaxID=2682957 RepID=A0ABR1K7Z7_9AGAR
MLPLLDILHRGVVYSLAGLTCWTIISSVAVHRETIQKGKGIVQLMARMEAEERARQEQLKSGSSPEKSQ